MMKTMTMTNKWFPTKRYVRAIVAVYLGIALVTAVIFTVVSALYVRPIETLAMLSVISTAFILFGPSLRLDDARSSLMRAIGSAHHSTRH
jgi:uncharacterized membrane protein